MPAFTIASPVGGWTVPADYAGNHFLPILFAPAMRAVSADYAPDAHAIVPKMCLWAAACAVNGIARAVPRHKVL